MKRKSIMAITLSSVITVMGVFTPLAAVNGNGINDIILFESAEEDVADSVMADEPGKEPLSEEEKSDDNSREYTVSEESVTGDWDEDGVTIDLDMWLPGYTTDLQIHDEDYNSYKHKPGEEISFTLTKTEDYDYYYNSDTGRKPPVIAVRLEDEREYDGDIWLPAYEPVFLSPDSNGRYTFTIPDTNGYSNGCVLKIFEYNNLKQNIWNWRGEGELSLSNLCRNNDFNDFVYEDALIHYQDENYTYYAYSDYSSYWEVYIPFVKTLTIDDGREDYDLPQEFDLPKFDPEYFRYMSKLESIRYAGTRADFESMLGDYKLYNVYVQCSDDSISYDIDDSGTDLNGTFTWNIKKDTLWIKGNGKYDFRNTVDSESGSPGWEKYRHSIKKVVLEGNISYIGHCIIDNYGENCGVFSDMGITEIILPDSLTQIGDLEADVGGGVFEDCRKLEKIKLPAGLTHIGDRTFEYCISLKSIEIPAGVTYIGSCAFYNCWELSTLTLSRGFYDSLGSYVSNLFSYTIYDSLPYTIYYSGTRAEWSSVIEKDSVNGYLPNYFKTFVVICSDGTYNADLWRWDDDTKTLTIMADDAYQYESRGQKGEYPWCHLSGEIKNLVLAEGVTKFELHKDALWAKWYPNLEKVEIPSTLKTVGDVRYCKKVKNLTLPIGIRIRFGDENGSSFDGWDSLEKVVFSGSSEKELCLDGAPFKNCNALEEISLPVEFYWEDGNPFPGSIKTIYYAGTGEQWGDKGKRFGIGTRVICSDREFDIESISGKFGEDEKWSLNTDGVLEITGTGEVYLSYRDDFDEVIWPESMDQKIKHIVVREGIIGLGVGDSEDDVEFDFGSVEDITIAGTVKELSLDMNALSSVNYIRYNGSAENFQKALDGAKLYNIEIVCDDDTIYDELAKSGTDCSKRINWSLTGDTLTISGSGAYDRRDENKMLVGNVGWEKYRSYVRHVIIDEGITSLGYVDSYYTDYSGGLFNHMNITDVKLPDSLERIGDDEGEGPDVPSGNNSGGYDVFGGCKYLTSVEIPSGVSFIAPGAFCSCDSLKMVRLSKNFYDTLGSSLEAFGYATAIKTIEFDGNMAEWKAIEQHDVGIDYLPDNIKTARIICNDGIIGEPKKKDDSSSSMKEDNSSSAGKDEESSSLKEDVSSSGKDGDHSSSFKEDSSSALDKESTSSAKSGESSSTKAESSSSSEKESGSTSEKESGSTSEKESGSTSEKEGSSTGKKEDGSTSEKDSGSSSEKESSSSSSEASDISKVITNSGKETVIVGDRVKIALTGIDPSAITAKGKAGIYANGFFTATGKGTVKLMAPVNKNGKIRQAVVCRIKVEVPRISKPLLVLKVGKTKKLKVSGTKTVPNSWTSSDKEIVGVSIDGTLTAKKPGSASVIATIGTHQYKCIVTVR